MENNVIMYISICLGIFLVAIVFAKPLKFVFKIIINSAIGCFLLAIFNFLGGIFGAYVGVNAFTCLTVGILGVPGFIMLLILQIILK